MPKGSASRLLLVRSGPTAWDEAGRLQGATDLPLSGAGVSLVRGELARLGVPDLTKVFTAPDEGSQQTAALLAKAAGMRAGGVKIIPELREMHLGLWEGALAAQLGERCTKAYRQWQDDPAAVRVPEGEEFVAFTERLNKVVGALMAKHGGGGAQGAGVAIVARPIAVGVIKCALNTLPTTALWSMVEERPRAEWCTVTPVTTRRPSMVVAMF